MIEPVHKELLPKCLKIIELGYENTAQKFGMTEENCPHRGRTRLPYHVFENEYENGCLMYVYILNGEIIGFLSLQTAEKTMHINDIVILPAYQNKGFGSALMQFVKEQAKASNCEKINLGMVHENIPLRKWYEKMGFKTIKPKQYEKVTYTVGTMELLL